MFAFLCDFNTEVRDRNNIVLCMVPDAYETYRGDCFVSYRNVKSLGCTPETDNRMSTVIENVKYKSQMLKCCFLCLSSFLF